MVASQTFCRFCSSAGLVVLSPARPDSYKTSKRMCHGTCSEHLRKLAAAISEQMVTIVQAWCPYLCWPLSVLLRSNFVLDILDRLGLKQKSPSFAVLHVQIQSCKVNCPPTPLLRNSQRGSKCLRKAWEPYVISVTQAAAATGSSPVRLVHTIILT